MLRITELADYLKVNPQTIYRMIHKGQITAVRIGRSIRIPESEFERIKKDGINNV